MDTIAASFKGIENEEYGYCSLIKATSNVLEKMKIENITRAKVTSSKRIEKHLVEPVPLREAIVNASVHNDFSKEIPPVFEISEHFIKVIFPLTMADGRDNGEDKLKRMLCAIEANPQITGKELSESLGVSNRNVSRIIKLLKEDQRIVRIGSDRKGYWEVQSK